MEEAEPGPGEKRCSTCREIKPHEAFNVLRKAKDGRQYNCRACNMAYHYANFDRHMERIRARRERRRLENQAWLIDYLHAHPCVDCGESDIVVLEFDHLRDKYRNVTMLVAGGWEWVRIVEEIAKCEVVCANCHRRRTAKRINSYRHRSQLGDA